MITSETLVFCGAVIGTVDALRPGVPRCPLLKDTNDNGLHAREKGERWFGRKREKLKYKTI